MAVTLVNLTGDLANLLDVSPDSVRTRVWIDTNIAEGGIVDSDGNTIRLGNAKADVGADGKFTFTGLIATNSTTNPTNFQYRVSVEYLPALPQQTSNGKHKRWTSGWFSLTATADLADVAAEQYAPPTYATTLTQQLDDHAATLQAPMDAAVTDAQGYAADAAASAQTAHDISGINTSDGVVKALVQDSGSQTAAALSASIGHEVSTPGTAAREALEAAFLRGRMQSSQVRNFMRKLRVGLSPAGVLVMGDSTGNGTDEWVYLTAQWLAARYPAYTVTHRLWNDTKQGYDAPTILQVGTGGRRRYTDPGNAASTNRIFTIADSAQTSITGDIDIRVRIKPNGDFTNGGVFAGKYSTGNIAWRVAMNPGGILLLSWSANGSTLNQATSTVGIGSTLLNSEVWLRYTLDVDNGASGYDVKFYTSTDEGVTWIQLGATVTGAGVTSIFDSTAATQFVGMAGAAFGNVGHAVDFYCLRVLPGLSNVSPVIDIDLGSWNWVDQASFPDAAGNSVAANVGSTGSLAGAFNIDFYNSSTPGMRTDYSYDATRYPKQAVGTVDLAFVSYSHNEGTNGPSFRTKYQTLTDKIVTQWPDVALVAVAQNPEKSPGPNVTLHWSRCSDILRYAATKRYATVDVYSEMLAADPTLGAFVNNGDGVHPTPAGSQFWADLVTDMLAVSE